MNENGRDLYKLGLVQLGTCTHLVYNTITEKHGVMTKRKCTLNPTERRVKTEIDVIKALTEAKVRGIPTLCDYGTIKDEVFMVTEYIGHDLVRIMADSKHATLNIKTVSNIGNYVLDVLLQIHLHGWIHGDIRPGNILVNTHPPRICWLVGFYRSQSLTVENVPVVTTDLLYTSPRIDGGYALHPLDDIMSLVYTLDHLLRGPLPWAQITDRDIVIKMKYRFKPHEILAPLYKFALSPDKRNYLGHSKIRL